MQKQCRFSIHVAFGLWGLVRKALAQTIGLFRPIIRQSK